MISDILITLLLVLLNAFFVAAEFAVVKVRHSQLDIKVKQGSSQAKIAKHIVDNMDSYLSACQLGITLASLALGWIGEGVVTEIILKIVHSTGGNLSETTAHQIAIPIAFAFITVLHIVLGEQAPKTIAIRNSLPTTLAVAIPLRVFYFIFSPFIWMLNGLSNLTLKLFRIKAVNESEDIHSEEELRMILTESEEGGAIKTSEHELIQNVFDFDDRIVKHIYVPVNKVMAISDQLSTEAIIDKIIEEGYSRLPVYKENIDNIIGVIYSKDILKLLKQNRFNSIQDILRPAYFVPLNKRINDLLNEFQTMHIQMAIVTNEFGSTAGIVTMEDIIEELVGEIQDEYDEEKPMVEKKSETEFIVFAQASISDVNDVLPIELPESQNYETVSGLMNEIFGRIPAVNEKKKFGGYEFTITKRQKHSVEFVKLIVQADSLENKE
ncbi:MAG: hemolysin family protein [Bacteroidota bacterium]